MPARAPVKIGERFARLVVIAAAPSKPRHLAGKPNARVYRAVCRCDCGNEATANEYDLRDGKTQSCGCLHREIGAAAGASTKTHGMTHTPTHKSWVQMRQRCFNPSNHAYANYGGRGITVCDRWASFEAFLEDMGERPSGLTLDRYPDNDGPYAPGNCRWATAAEQHSNRRDNQFVMLYGERMIVAEACRRLGVNPSAISARVRRRHNSSHQEATDAIAKRRGKTRGSAQCQEQPY